MLVEPLLPILISDQSLRDNTWGSGASAEVTSIREPYRSEQSLGLHAPNRRFHVDWPHDFALIQVLLS